MLKNGRNHLSACVSDMDKEDALICFEEVIKEYEKEEQEKQERKKVLQKRHFRKNREKFNVSAVESL